MHDLNLRMNKGDVRGSRDGSRRSAPPSKFKFIKLTFEFPKISLEFQTKSFLRPPLDSPMAE